MTRIASVKTLNASKKTRLAYAYRAAERDSMSGDSDLEKRGDDAIDQLLAGSMPKSEQLDWAIREQTWRELHS
ncbi:hypothetical protein [Vibrio sp. TRT 29B02]|uniref:hypothetical protein n=1 Tax=Vibrio sp. TRT 29B02 TaxID=3418508 RepID=UPI003CFB0098